MIIMGTDDQIGDLRERLARMEERQLSLYKMVETSLSNYADVVNRISSLEHLRTKALAIAGVVGLICSMAWDVLKNRFNS